MPTSQSAETSIDDAAGRAVPYGAAAEGDWEEGEDEEDAVHVKRLSRHDSGGHDGAA